ncbi:hypothetical protein NESM_000166600 [Novymonas esmeraldas]|uniref:Uncharacterized protein n=1 Tax=Novymonas esmeraldas TaxID=1808958 RepID=A0AAW0F5W8_9TRYP
MSQTSPSVSVASADTSTSLVAPSVASSDSAGSTAVPTGSPPTSPHVSPALVFTAEQEAAAEVGAPVLPVNGASHDALDAVATDAPTHLTDPPPTLVPVLRQWIHGSHTLVPESGASQVVRGTDVPHTTLQDAVPTLFAAAEEVAAPVLAACAAAQEGLEPPPPPPLLSALSDRDGHDGEVAEVSCTGISGLTETWSTAPVAAAAAAAVRTVQCAVAADHVEDDAGVAVDVAGARQEALCATAVAPSVSPSERATSSSLAASPAPPNDGAVAPSSPTAHGAEEEDGVCPQCTAVDGSAAPPDSTGVVALLTAEEVSLPGAPASLCVGEVEGPRVGEQDASSQPLPPPAGDVHATGTAADAGAEEEVGGVGAAAAELARAPPSASRKRRRVPLAGPGRQPRRRAQHVSSDAGAAEEDAELASSTSALPGHAAPTGTAVTSAHAAPPSEAASEVVTQPLAGVSVEGSAAELQLLEPPRQHDDRAPQLAREVPEEAPPAEDGGSRCQPIESEPAHVSAPKSPTTQQVCQDRNPATVRDDTQPAPLSEVTVSDVQTAARHGARGLLTDADAPQATATNLPAVAPADPPAAGGKVRPNKNHRAAGASCVATSTVTNVSTSSKPLLNLAGVNVQALLAECSDPPPLFTRRLRRTRRRSALAEDHRLFAEHRELWEGDAAGRLFPKAPFASDSDVLGSLTEWAHPPALVYAQLLWRYAPVELVRLARRDCGAAAHGVAASASSEASAASTRVKREAAE